MAGRCFAYAVVACASLAGSLSVAHAGPRAVVELFTSQGCSSCPPADRLLGELASDPSFVALTWPVDYWDYLGWKDTLADPRSAIRQTAYMKARGDRERYTPQAVVNGALHALGSSRDAIEKAIAKSRQDAAVLSVPVTLAIDGGKVSISAPGIPNLEQGVDVWIAGLSRSVAVAIKRGENKGKTITYYNVVRSWTKLGSGIGSGSHWTIPIAGIKQDGADTAVVLVQSGTELKPGAILGASIAPLR
jgi:hypothetical protein